MKKTLIILSYITIMVSCISQQKISFDEFITNGEKYINQKVTITTPLYVTGVYYDSLILSTERLYVPEERAIGLSEGDSTELKRLQAENIRQSIRLNAKYYPYQIKTGSIAKNLKAMVCAARNLVTGQSPKLKHNKPKAHKPDLNGADLIVCAANIQNYFADLGGYAGATDEVKFKMQTEKVARGLRYMNADIYAICEMEKGNKSPETLVQKMNALAHKDIYAYVDNDGGDGDGDTISVCFIYRKDKVKPYGPTLYAYSDVKNIYHNRFKTHGFEELKSGERFAISLNHPRSKRGDPHRADSLRMDNIYHIETILNQMQETYDDPDILLLGDYNCYTQERPLQYIRSLGYEDEIMKHDSLGYSYVWKGEMGYLDRVFANPSMDKQIVSVHPVHVNADCFYSLGYKSRYAKPNIFRYSDHEPILIGICLGEKRNRQ